MSSSSPASIRSWGLNGWRALERHFDWAFGSAFNPLRHLGPIGFLALWLLVATGVVLFALFDTSVTGAYESVQRLAGAPLGLGRLLRGVHRYAADTLMLVMLLHILREWLHGHERGVRRFHWLTGVPLVVFCFASAIGGFWLAWDRLSQYSALAMAEWLDLLPLLATPLARNFLTVHAVSDRLFSLFIFVHLGVPVLFLFGLWFHIQRLAHASVLPPRRLALGLVGVLALLALVRPVLSDAPAALDQVPSVLHLDWLLLWLHPLTDATSRGFTWALVAAALLLLLALPFLPQPARAAVAVVDPDNCSGCQRCFADCPYAAITMVPHPGRSPGHQLAQVDADLCIGCGICAGACPSSTPFRGMARLVTGIDMPQLPVDVLRRDLRQGLAAAPAVPPVVLFACAHGAPPAESLGPGVQVHALLCAGQLPPSFVEYALRDGAAGVLVAACPEGGCEFRLGERWTAERLARRREPHLRARVPAERVELVHAGSGDQALLGSALERLRRRLQGLSDDQRISTDERFDPT
ncbi:MAG TPA: hydrogenase iron-sulfur subunit [Ottowia sp.]|uniref:hydrogenase iron-sulfur subunit n=1 Tax=Ottowia sp. TaxID=1898956 RepID=UPI002B9E91AD|nr:hydrogenase iron-sulfur subunit [Ottowia sp.]HMN20437.1 hydrogenase iron-sulfur subunit [Ottowia sp.]